MGLKIKEIKGSRKMKKITMEQDFDNTQKTINDNGIELEARDVYLAYIAKALCIIADKMSEDSGTVLKYV